MTDDAMHLRLLDALTDGTAALSAVVASEHGELLAARGARDEASAAAVALALHELARVGQTLSLGALEAASLKSPTAGHVVGRAAECVVAIELDPRRGVGELETRMRTWASNPPVFAEASAPRTLPPPPPIPVRPTPSTSTAPPVAAALVPGLRQAPPRLPSVLTRASVPSNVKAVGTGPVFAGDLAELALPDLLEFLRLGQRTGLLVCTTPFGVGAVRLHRGLVSGASSPRAPEPLHATPPAAGDDRNHPRVAQIYDAFREMLVWREGRFAFEPELPSDASAFSALSAQTILMHLYQEQDEQNR